MADFTWEDFSLRSQVASALLKTTTVDRFMIIGNDAADVYFGAGCGYDNSVLCLEFFKPRRLGLEVSVEELDLDQIAQDLSGLVRPFFESLLAPKVKKLGMRGYGIFANCVIWQMLIPYLPQSHLEELDLDCNYLRDDEVFLLVKGIRHMKSLQKINLNFNDLSYTGLMAIMSAAPATAKHVSICYTIKDLERDFFPL
ncbi:unnamed protein product [Aphanomyces euteiches]|uniref:Uncharacterized protein n=1 Tax=Aphanomyces euteiches TaxID=100861 RepID=A0A6G0WV71_9STRA|nr:hypothetical protein Ae201684_011279 [Aphanomyces euteiches]KAH9101206.1 hypothetical protein Ae201684P_007390 [Aphanomyces euteiches]KAH9151012.1 hypothetical protein AeRB84_006271 [Aphanomyces euteiches]